MFFCSAHDCEKLFIAQEFGYIHRASLPGPTQEITVHILTNGYGEYFSGYSIESIAIVELTPGIALSI